MILTKIVIPLDSIIHYKFIWTDGSIPYHVFGISTDETSHLHHYVLKLGDLRI